MKLETVKSEFWQEVPEPDDPFGARICRCAGYDVYGELIQRASYIEVLYLIFCGERPTREAARMLQILAIALANPGPRDPMVHAAMSAGVGGSTHAACLMAALAVGAGQRGGARELVLAMEMFAVAGVDVVAWRAQFARGYARPFRDGWGELEHFPGFDPNAKVCALPVVQSLAALADRRRDGRTVWLCGAREELQQAAGLPLSMIGVAAVVFLDLELSTAQAEMLFLLLRLPGAAAHALEQESLGWKHFPFFNEVLKLKDVDVGEEEVNATVECVAQL